MTCTEKSRKTLAGWAICDVVLRPVRSQPRVVCAALFSSVLMAGCGMSHKRAKTAHHVTYPVNGVQLLVQGYVRADTRFTIYAERYDYLGRSSFGLKGKVARPSDVARAGSASTSFISGEKSQLVMLAKTGCVDHHTYALMFGLLRAINASVTAEYRGRAYSLRHARIPSRFRAGGALVYGVLPGVPTEVDARVGGAVVAKERYNALAGGGCSGGSEGSSVVGAVG